MGGKSPGEEVGLAGPGQRTEVLGSRAEALAGREVGWGGVGSTGRGSIKAFRASKGTHSTVRTGCWGGPASLKSIIQHKDILGVEAGLPSKSGVR